MKAVFFIILGVLLLLSLAAWQMQPAPVSPDKTQIVWVSDDNPARREQIALFNRMNPDCMLTLDPSTSDMSKIIVQSVAGVGPDVFDCTGSQLPAYVKSGIALDITDEFKKAGINPADEIWPEIFPAMFYNGRLYGIATNAGTVNIMFNKDLFDQAGLPYPKGPWKWNELIPVAQRLTVRDEHGRITCFGLLAEWWWWHQFVLQWGGQVFSDDGIRCVLDSPESIAAIQFLHDLVYKYHVSPTPTEEQSATQGGWGSGSMSWFAGGKAAMAIGGRWWLCSLRENKELRIGAAETPYHSRRVFVGLGRGVLINKNSPRKEQALKFLKYLMSQEYNELINHQADAAAPVRKYAYTEQFLHDPAYPDEDFNDVWRESLKHAVPDPVNSPFVSNPTVLRIVMKQLDMVKFNQKIPAQAMKAATQQINAEIQKTLENDPELRRQYERLVNKSKNIRSGAIK